MLHVTWNDLRHDSSGSGAGKKRALAETAFNARQLGDAHARLRQLIRGLQPGVTNCFDDEQRELALSIAPYFGIQRPQALTHDFIAESVAFVVWEQHATTRLVALRRRNTNVRNNYVPAMRKLLDQLQAHFGLETRDGVISVRRRRCISRCDRTRPMATYQR